MYTQFYNKVRFLKAKTVLLWFTEHSSITITILHCFAKQNNINIINNYMH